MRPLTITTANQVTALRGEESGPYRVPVEGVKDLQVQVTPTGHKSWVIKYRDPNGRRGKKTKDGKPGKLLWKHHKIADAKVLGLADAKKLAKAELAKITLGHNPKARPEVEPQSVAAIVNHYLEQKQSAKSYQLMLSYKRDLPEWFLKMNATDVTTDDAFEVIRPVTARAPTRGNRVLAWIRAIWNMAIDARYDLTRDREEDFGVTENPFKGLKRVKAAERAAETRLTLENLAATWVHAEKYNSLTSRLALRFHIAMYGQRVKNTLYAEWDEIVEIDGITCLTLPEGRTKSGHPHTFPLTELALEVLEEWKEYVTPGHQCVWPQRFSNGETPMTTLALGYAAREVRKHDPKCGDFAPRFCRATAVTELGNAGVNRSLIDYAHQRYQREFSTVGTKSYDRATRVKQLKEGVADVWDELLRKAIADYRKERF